VIPVRRLPLEPGTERVLAKRQASAAKLAPGARQIQQRWNYFLRPGANTKALADVRAKLDAMFLGNCCYCEKIIAKDIEHFYPKSLHPGRMFTWENMLRVCKDCNFEKHEADPDVPLDAAGQRTLLDPTKDRPEDYLEWNLEDGLPIYRNLGAGVHRGQRTVETCDLDNQKFNEQRRRRALEFVYLMDRAHEETPVRPATRELLDELTSPGQPWLGVIRQIVRDPAQRSWIDVVEYKLPHLGPRFAAFRWTHP
jgi:uncharacterized protein (TIGR02646 family)